MFAVNALIGVYRLINFLIGVGQLHFLVISGCLTGIMILWAILRYFKYRHNSAVLRTLTVCAIYFWSLMFCWGYIGDDDEE